MGLLSTALSNKSGRGGCPPKGRLLPGFDLASSAFRCDHECIMLSSAPPPPLGFSVKTRGRHYSHGERSPNTHWNDYNCKDGLYQVWARIRCWTEETVWQVPIQLKRTSQNPGSPPPGIHPREMKTHSTDAWCSNGWSSFMNAGARWKQSKPIRYEGIIYASPTAG